MLGTIQNSIYNTGSKLPPVGTSAKLEELTRVLAREEEDKSTCDALNDPKIKTNKKEHETKPPSSGGSSGQIESSVSSSRLA